eukprot:12806739-Prorocentrum_lima.AAC.1
MKRYQDWYLPQWDKKTAWGTTTYDFDAYIEDVGGRACQGGLLELSAACSAFRLQAVVYDSARDQYIIIGKKDRQVMPCATMTSTGASSIMVSGFQPKRS